MKNENQAMKTKLKMHLFLKNDLLYTRVKMIVTIFNMADFLQSRNNKNLKYFFSDIFLIALHVW